METIQKKIASKKNLKRNLNAPQVPKLPSVSFGTNFVRFENKRAKCSCTASDRHVFYTHTCHYTTKPSAYNTNLASIDQWRFMQSNSVLG